MNSLKIEIEHKSPRRRHRPPPIKIEQLNSWSETKTPYDPPSPPNRNKIHTTHITQPQTQPQTQPS